MPETLMGDWEMVVGCLTTALEIRCYQNLFERLN